MKYHLIHIKLDNIRMESYYNILIQERLIYFIWINGDYDNYDKFLKMNNIKLDIYKSTQLSGTVSFLPDARKCLKLIRNNNISVDLDKQLSLYKNICSDDTIEVIQLPLICLSNITIKRIPNENSSSYEHDHPEYIIANIHINNDLKNDINIKSNNNIYNNMDIFNILNQFQKKIGRKWGESLQYINNNCWQLKILISRSSSLYCKTKLGKIESSTIHSLDRIKTCNITMLLNYGYDLITNKYYWHFAQGLTDIS